MAHGRDPEYQTRVDPDKRFVTRAELRIDMEKCVHVMTEMLKDSMSECVSLLYLVLGEEKMDAAIAKARIAQETTDRVRDSLIEESAHSIAEDMQRFDDARKQGLKLQ